MNLRLTLSLMLLGVGLASSPTRAGTPPKHGLHVGAYRVERDVKPGRNKVVGTLSNAGRARVRTVRISFRLFDARGHAIGRATAEAHDLAPGQVWKFHAPARGNVSRARLLQVEAR
ncbi:FxLYD domain-containing protein [Dyella sedimenti]|uniref:FxLYD domain-containing protein n=1 Tax=Dyella sedimenti TaxID=2919947 RepID=UPI001FA9B3FC|nr:FxLYD domain-containing protein [Dyella sedimenti]